MNHYFFAAALLCFACNNAPATNPNPTSPPGSSSAPTGDPAPAPNDPTTVQASTYDQKCTQDVDCLAVKTGNVCHACCNTDAINVAESGRFKTDVEAKQAACGKMMACTILCKQSHAACVSGKCTLQPGEAP